MEILKRGAEAILYLDKEKNLIKERIKKSYRLEQIDEKLRVERTRAEARLLNEAARAGVAVPKIFSVDESGAKIIMEFLSGERLKEAFNSEIDIEKKKFWAGEIGKSIGKLHSHNLIHGDLTTSNLILMKEKIFFIDFGLGFQSNKIEDFATDLSVLKEAIKSTHIKLLDVMWKVVFEGYAKTFEKYQSVSKILEEIEKRGRYAQRAG